MAPPATKRRKLEHSDSEGEESEGSFAGFDESNGVDSEAGAGAEEDELDGSDVSMDGAEDFKNLRDGDEETENSEEEAMEENETKPATAVKATNTQKPPKRPAPSLQDGVYTSESFKSNIFKLQVDNLLEQVRLRYGKKEAPAENAMRTLKTIIEQLPSRDALPVRAHRNITYPAY